MAREKDHGVDHLLALNGDRYFVDEKGEFEAIFEVKSVPVTPERPHGLKYSLVLLDANGDRVVGFDNAHGAGGRPGPGKKRRKQYDHKHIGKRVTVYKFKDSLTLLADFWKKVDKWIL